MKSAKRLFCMLSIGFAALANANDEPAFKAALEESKSTGRGLTFYVNGQAIGGAVVSIDDKYVVAKSQALGLITLRRERIDAVSGFVGAPAGSKAN
ncbi:MAG: hypothetical protein IPN53_16550 [Comamonadaceae bacterium]|nr:hypothetical protein [Comamonadaceae bacterium]